MTKQEILQMVKEYFQEGGLRDDGSCSEYYGDPDAFVKFAQAIGKQSVSDGYRKGYCDGYDEGVYQESYNNTLRDLDIFGIE